MCSPPKTPNELGKQCGTVGLAIGKSIFKLYSHLEGRNMCLSNACGISQLQLARGTFSQWMCGVKAR